MPNAVQPRIQEPQRSFATRNEIVVEQRDDGRKRRRGSRRSINQDVHAGPHHGKVHALRRHIGVRPAARIVEAVEGAAQPPNIGGHDIALVVGHPEVVGEAAAGREAVDGVEGHHLGAQALGGADGRDERTAGRERRHEHGRVRAVVARARAVAAHAQVAARVQQRHAARAQLRELLADGRGVGFRHRLLVVAVARRDGRRDGGVRQAEHVCHPVEVRLVGVVHGCQVGVERRRASSVVGLYGDWMSYADDGFGVQIPLDIQTRVLIGV